MSAPGNPMQIAAGSPEPGAGGPAAPPQPEVNPKLGMAPPTQMSDMLKHFGGMQDQARARFDRVEAAAARLALVRKQLDGLAELGDMVSTEDLVKAGGELVGAGLGAAAVAGVLADAPEGGAALQDWVARKDQEIQEREMQMQQALAMTAQDMMVTSLRHIIAQSAEQHGGGSEPLAPENNMELR